MVETAITDSGPTSWDRRIVRTVAAGPYVVRVYDMPSEQLQLVTFECLRHPRWRKWKVSRDDAFIAETFWRWALHARLFGLLQPVTEWLRPLGWRW
ncbi:hypothetical protein GCM10009099_24760 [Caenispirillum bisanense]